MPVAEEVCEEVTEQGEVVGSYSMEGRRKLASICNDNNKLALLRPVVTLELVVSESKRVFTLTRAKLQLRDGIMLCIPDSRLIFISDVGQGSLFIVFRAHEIHSELRTTVFRIVP
jgi:hypothetical protein